jgi:glycine cleavage system H protein
MAEVPDDLKYTAEHEWARIDAGGSTIRIGITDFAQAALGDVVYVSLPEVGASVKLGEAFGEVESTKSVSDLYGWVVEIELSEPAQLSGLLDAAAYGTLSG